MSSKAKFIEVQEQSKELKAITEKAQAYLIENGITISQMEAIPTIVYGFLQQTIQYLNKAKTEDDEVELNMMQLFDIGISSTDEGMVPYLTPGQEFKLLIKSDDESEEE